MDSGGKAGEELQKMASAYGIGSAPGVDLPADEQASGSYADRETRMARWQADKAQYCKDAQTGFPGDPDNAYLTELAKENCTDGWRYRAGDNADMAIGQGETTLSPLQLAVAYSALVNGGTLWRPTLGWAAVDAQGHVVRTIDPTVKAKVPVAPADPGLHHGRPALHARPLRVRGAGLRRRAVQTAARRQDRHRRGVRPERHVVAGVVGADDHRTPAGKTTAKYVVVGMVENTGTGATAAAPMLRQIYDGLLGAGRPAVLPQPETALPDLSRLGAAPATAAPATTTAPSAPATPARPAAAVSSAVSPAVPSFPPRTGSGR